MAIVFDKETVLKVLSEKLTDEEYLKAEKALNDCPEAEVIPISYIESFVDSRDPVYQTNISTLLASYYKETCCDVCVSGESSE